MVLWYLGSLWTVNVNVARRRVLKLEMEDRKVIRDPKRTLTNMHALMPISFAACSLLIYSSRLRGRASPKILAVTNHRRLGITEAQSLHDGRDRSVGSDAAMALCGYTR